MSECREIVLWRPERMAPSDPTYYVLPEAIHFHTNIFIPLQVPSYIQYTFDWNTPSTVNRSLATSKLYRPLPFHFSFSWVCFGCGLCTDCALTRRVFKRFRVGISNARQYRQVTASAFKIWQDVAEEASFAPGGQGHRRTLDSFLTTSRASVKE